MTSIIGITTDLQENRYKVRKEYAEAIENGGGIPFLLPPISGMEARYIELCDGFIFTGGDDPIMEHWGIQSNSLTTPVNKRRQDFELNLLSELQHHPEKPVLGVCLGMQWMCLIAGGSIEQDLAEPFASNHKNQCHKIDGELGTGFVHSHHHQAMNTAGSLTIIATADDGVIEAVQDKQRSWYLGVQWHPERTEDVALGQGLFNILVQSCSHKTVSNR